MSKELLIAQNPNFVLTPHGSVRVMNTGERARMRLIAALALWRQKIGLT